MALSGPIASSSFGWPAIFYFYGVVALLWWIVWVLVVKESPEKDEKVSAEELALYKQGNSLLEEEDEIVSCFSDGLVESWTMDAQIEDKLAKKKRF
jgi:hypothetical protein